MNLLRIFRFFLFLFMTAGALFAQASSNLSEAGNLIPNEHDIKIADYILNCKTYGEGGPTVVLINGMGANQKYWDSVIPGIAEFTTVFTYDSQGIGKSSKGSYPPSGDKEIKDLMYLLEDTGVPKPYILVGHSFGGMYARLFAAWYPEFTAGLILEDATPLGLDHAINEILEGDEKEKFSNFLKMKPPAMNRTEELVKTCSLPEIPLIVLSAGARNSMTSFSEETRKKVAEIEKELGSNLSRLIKGGKQITVEEAGHSIHLQNPDVVVDAVKEIIEKIEKK